MRWVAAGAPRGDGEAPEPPPIVEAEWTLGQPDVILEIEPVDVPADGPDQFVQRVIPTGFESDQFVTAIEILPGDRKVVHHVLLWMANESGTAPQAMLGGWAAGAAPNITPDGTGRLVKKGHPLLFDMHYHPYGQATTDKTRIGIHVAKADTKIEKEFVNLWVLNADFKIPAGDPNAEATSSYTFTEDVTVLSLTPHMHYRGKDFKFTATWPDGTSKELLKVSKYDFNWQTTYDFERAARAPRRQPHRLRRALGQLRRQPRQPGPHQGHHLRPAVDRRDDDRLRRLHGEGRREPEADLTADRQARTTWPSTYPGQVWRVDVSIQPGKAPEPTAVHLPREGNGGWYVAIGTLVLPAPIHYIVWDGNKVTAKAEIPNQGTMEMSGVVLDSGDIDLTMGGGTIRGVAADTAAKVSIPTG